MMRRITLIALVVASLFLVATPALARNASDVGGGTSTSRGNTTLSATLYSSCNPCVTGAFVHFWGSGYNGSQPRGAVAFVNSAAGYTVWGGINVNPDGTTSFDWYPTLGGTFDVKVFQQRHRKSVLMAELDGLVIQ